MTYLNILWHFHQPWYIMPQSRIINVPTITFRVLYNYYPMAKMIESSGVKLGCNFTVPLLLQIQEIANGEVVDDFQRILIDENSNEIEKVKMFCEDLPDRAKKSHTIFRNLLDKLYREKMSKQEIADLKMWMHLCCFHPLMSKYYVEIENLKEKGVGFNQKDMEMLLEIEKKVFSGVLSLYKQLLHSGLIEISITPGYHPIMPLVYNIKIARETKTSLRLPEIDFSYPEDVRAHIETGFDVAEKLFGKKPDGIWPAEGSISNDVLDMFSDYKIAWIGADEQILNSSRAEEKDATTFLYTWKDSFFIFFRNHEFSDRIGFVYQSWDEKQAAADLIKRIESLSDSREKILTIILDGENPWEWYSQQGSIFLNEFYTMAISSKKIKMLTPKETGMLDFKKISLSSLPAGSWMGLNFDNWIGSEDANRIWGILGNVRKTVKQHDVKMEQNDKIKKLILMAECSDFFWWMSVPASQSVKMRFYGLFQSIVSEIYKELGLVVPVEVVEAWSPATKIPEPDRYISPYIDGKITSFFEWSGAAEISIEKLWITFQPFQLPVRKIFYGYDRENLYIRIDIAKEDFSLLAIESKKEGTIFTFDRCKDESVKENIAIDRCIEIALPLVKFIDNNEISFAIRLKIQDTEIRIPPAGFLTCVKKVFDDEWMV